LRNGDQINSPAGELPENRHGLTALGMEPIVYLPLAMRLTSSMWLFWAGLGWPGYRRSVRADAWRSCGAYSELGI